MVVSSLTKESSDAETNKFPRPLIVKADVDMKTSLWNHIYAGSKQSRKLLLLNFSIASWSYSCIKPVMDLFL